MSVRGAWSPRGPGSPRRAGQAAMKHEDCTGMTLVDSVAGAAVVAILAGMAVPFLMVAREQSRVAAAAAYLSAQAMLARSRAVGHGTAVGLRFEVHADGYRFSSYVDGDGDGIRGSDVARGVDRPLGPPQQLGHLYPSVRFGLLASVPPIGSSRPAGSRADPVRFGRGDTLTFSPLGTATSGTLYLHGSREQYAVRVLGATGRVQVLYFDAAAASWRRR